MSDLLHFFFPHVILCFLSWLIFVNVEFSILFWNLVFGFDLDMEDNLCQRMKMNNLIHVNDINLGFDLNILRVSNEVL